MKINDKNLYIKLPMEDKSFVTLPNSFNLSYNLFDRDDITDIGDNALYYLNYNEKTSITNFSLPNLETISGIYALYYAFQGCPHLKSVDLSNLITVTGRQCLYGTFENCTNLTSVDLSNLTLIDGTNIAYYTFYNTGITSLDLSSLTTVNSTMTGIFRSCAKLITVDLGSLKTIITEGGLYETFGYCTKLTNVNLNSLSNIPTTFVLRETFSHCLSLKTLMFPSLTSTSFGVDTSQFYNMLSGVTGCTVHFPVSLQSVIGNWTDVTNGFGGTNTTVLFDLNGGRMAYTSEDGETVYTADNTDVLQPPSVGDTMYTKSGNTYTSVGSVSEINGNKITTSDYNSSVVLGYHINSYSGLVPFGAIYYTFGLVGRGDGTLCNIKFYDSNLNVISNSNYPSAFFDTTRVNVPDGAYSVEFTMDTSTGRYIEQLNVIRIIEGNTYKRDGSKDIINYVS